MKSFSIKKALTLSCLVCLALPLACGDDDDDSSGNTAGKGGSSSVAGGGSGGKSGSGNTTSGTAGRAQQPTGGEGGAMAVQLPPGLSDEASTKTCGDETCESAQAAVYFVDPCCAADNVCGLNTAFLSLVGAQFTETCQARDQPGTDEGSCPAATGLAVPYNGQMLPLDPFPGCCREDGSCGVVVDVASTGNGALPLASLELGCVEAAPFFDGVSRSCFEAGGGAGGAGAGGSGIAGASSGGDGTGGAQ